VGARIFSDQLYFVAASDYQMSIDGAITDGESPVEAHLRARLTNDNTYTGRTQAWSDFRGLDLIGANGRISGSTQIDVFAAEMTLDNYEDVNNNETADDFNTDRLNDSANVALREGSFNVWGQPEGELTETIGSLEIVRGKNFLRFDPYGQNNTGVHLSNTSDALTRPDRGTALIDTIGNPDLGVYVKITMDSAPSGATASGVIPYLTAYGYLDNTWAYTPVVYDKGDDEAIGGGDDVGLRPLRQAEYTDLTSSSTMQHALSFNNNTLTQATVCDTLTLAGQGTLTLNSTLNVTEGVVVVNDSSKLMGSSFLTLGGTEGIIHVPSGMATIDAPMVAHNLTKAGDGALRLTNPNNQITGETVVNGTRLEIASPTAAGTTPIQMYNANLFLDFASGTFASTTTWESGAGGPTGGFSWINELRLRDGATVTYTGRIEGDGATSLAGAGSKLVMTNTATNTNPRTPFFLLGTDTTLELNGIFGTPGGAGYLWMNSGSRLMGVGTAIANVVVQTGATVAPGSTASPVGILTVERLELQGGGTLELQNAATGVRGVAYDAVNVTDNGAQLFGKIHLRSSGTVHPVGTLFEVIHFDSSYVGVPTITTDIPLAGGRQYVPIFYPDKLVIGVAGFTGDANLDGKVNTIDFNSLAGNFGQTVDANWLMGDFNFDRAVSSTDFNLFAANYGKKVAGLAPTLGSTVPEPSSGVLLAGAISFLTRRKR